jgi:hypothetical protein
MIFKHVPLLSGLTNLIATKSYTTIGVANVLLLLLISTYTKLGVDMLVVPVDNYVH